MNEELQKKLAARLKLSGGGEEDASPAPVEEAKRASAPGRLTIPGGMGRFNPAAMGGVPSPFAMAGVGGGAAGGRSSAPVAGQPLAGMFGGGSAGGRPMGGGDGGGGSSAKGALDPLPTKAKGPAGRRKPTSVSLSGRGV
mmetsp:Transcript_39391/g.77168  ORF Transcript_39391/g.77168 Transcript_39391/m.77168 type:complete len:140 (+) Transcript_39391:155-574(+)